MTRDFDGFGDGDIIPEAVWHSRYQRAMNSRAGLQRLLEAKAALEALPEKRLCEGTLSDGKSVCFVGAIVAKRAAAKNGVDLAAEIAALHAELTEEWMDYEDLMSTATAGKDVGLPWTVAWEWAVLNDHTWGTLTDEERYSAALAWLNVRIASHPLAEGRS